MIRSVKNSLFWTAVTGLGAVGMVLPLLVVRASVLNGLPLIMRVGSEFFYGVVSDFFEEGSGGIGPEIVGP